MSTEKWKNFAKTLGPGIMFAGTCVGGSHLVQSTKAGAYYGMGLLVIVLAANLFKYPFFEFASRYTNATGDSILEGYQKQGKWILGLYGIVTIFSMFIITAAIGFFTAGLMSNIFLSVFGIQIDAWLSTIILYIVVFALLFKGEFKVLDLTLKVVGIILVLTVFIAFFALVFGEPMPETKQGLIDILSPEINPVDGTSDYSGLIFAIALMGWMPIAVDMSSWASLWTQERIKQTKYHPTLKETLLDFNIGYIITVILAICFLTIGTYVLFGNEEITSADIASMSGLAYAQTLVAMFTNAVGDWSYYIITLAAFATMFGTTITLIDGYCRSIERTLSLLKPKQSTDQKVFHKKFYLTWVALAMLGSFLIIKFYVSNLGQIMNLATTLSFVIAPFAAILNFRLMSDPAIPIEKRPAMWLKVLAIFGIVFLSVFSVLFLII